MPSRCDFRVPTRALDHAPPAAGWNVADEIPYWITCLLIAAWGALGLRLILTESQQLHAEVPSDA